MRKWTYESCPPQDSAEFPTFSSLSFPGSGMLFAIGSSYFQGAMIGVACMIVFVVVFGACFEVRRRNREKNSLQMNTVDPNW